MNDEKYIEILKNGTDEEVRGLVVVFGLTKERLKKIDNFLLERFIRIYNNFEKPTLPVRLSDLRQ
jgi:hypothetical protein